jgi:hypothetical protein
VFALLIILAVLLPRPELVLVVKELAVAVGRLEKKLHSVHINEILRKMGFPQNWQDIRQ